MTITFWIFLLCVTLVTKIGVDLYAFYAIKNGIVDHGDGLRKLQKKPIPVSGGVVVFFVTLCSLSVAYFLRIGWGNEIIFNARVVLFLGISFILVVTGFIDDKNGMKGKKKLLIQVLGATVLAAYAQRYCLLEIFGHVVNLGCFFLPCAIFWLVGFINAINFLDGADGVASTIGILILVTSGVLCGITGDKVTAFCCWTMVASLFGFFLCNRPPAKIYLGDSGSMLIGFTAGVLLLKACSERQPSSDLVMVHFFPAITIVCLPAFDSMAAIIRRKLTGRSIYFTDRSHLHHRIQTCLGKNYILLLVLTLLQLPLSLGGIAGIYFKNDWYPVTALVLIVVGSMISGLFGRNELILIFKAVGHSLGRLFGKEKASAGKSYLATEDYWQPLWKLIVKRTEKFPCFYAALDINIPRMELEYCAQRGDAVLNTYKENSFDRRRVLSVRTPLMRNDHYCGNLFLQFDLKRCDSQEAIELAQELTSEVMESIEGYLKSKK